ncbi:AT-rich interactive domain-containing protein 1B [Anopheles moucheti]|uniref:AT-rich interactive domain-containing protein 1B n=1 Tax=Anopheles moucheti TaxID=186751 RepID=UPI0022F0C6EE|nr:AT-rich interactive domain-containing protein 1B [Anopheles moucheti]
MVSQLTVYAKILCLLMTLFSAGASTGNDIYLQSACNYKFLRAKNGSVFADDNLENGLPQIFSLNATRTRDNRVAVTIYSKETDSYICFDKNWRIKTMRGKANVSKRRCMFFENIDASGAIRYRSVVNQNHSLGFQRNGKPIGGKRAGGKMGPGGGGGVGRKKPIDEKCYTFNPTSAHGSNEVQHQHQLNHPQRHEAKATRPHQQQPNQPPRQRHHRQQEARKDGSAGESNGGNSLLTSSYSASAPSDQRQAPQSPNPHRHKHGTAQGRHGRKVQLNPGPAAAAGHPNLESGYTGATTLPVAVTLSSLAYGSGANANGGDLGGDGRIVGPAYGKGTHRRSHLNSYTPPLAGDTLPSLPLPVSSLSSAIVTKLPPKSTAHTGPHPGARPGLVGLLEAGAYRKDRRQTVAAGGGSLAPETTNGGRVGSGKRKSASSSNGTGAASGRNASSKASAMPGRDKRASG